MFRVPRSRTSQTHREMRDEIIAALEPILFDAYQHSYPLRRQLEDAFATEVGKRYAVAVHSGTVALVIALRACGIGPGDEVTSVGNSDISTTGAISLCGAAPVLCDVLESDYTLDIATVAAQITERTRAILPVDPAWSPGRCQSPARPGRPLPTKNHRRRGPGLRRDGSRRCRSAPSPMSPCSASRPLSL